MDRETLMKAIRKGPVRVYMNDGHVYLIPSSEFAIVSEIAAYVLVQESNGKYAAKILALVCMTQIEELKIPVG